MVFEKIYATEPFDDWMHLVKVIKQRKPILFTCGNSVDPVFTFEYHTGTDAELVREIIKYVPSNVMYLNLNCAEENVLTT